MDNLTGLTNTNVVALCEKSIQAALLNALGTASIPVLISDTVEIKDPMPYIVLHGDRAEEQIGPGSGIFKVQVTVTLRDHVKAGQGPSGRNAIMDAINYFAYGTPVPILNRTSGFHVYGFIPEATGQMEVLTDLKAFEYLTTWTLVCMPRDNQ